MPTASLCTEREPANQQDSDVTRGSEQGDRSGDITDTKRRRERALVTPEKFDRHPTEQRGKRQQEERETGN